MSALQRILRASTTECLILTLVVLTMISPTTLASPVSSHEVAKSLTPAEVAHVKAAMGATIAQVLSDHPLATPAPTTNTAGVGAFTTDPAVINNTGIATNITLPSGFTPPSSGCVGGSFNGTTVRVCALLGVEEPTNASSLAFIGAAFMVVTISGITAQGAIAVARLPNGTFIANPSQSAILGYGQTYEFSILHSTGDWWNFQYATSTSSTPLTGSAKWENGTYKLNVTEALGIHYNGTYSGYPMQVLAELNTSYSVPLVKVPTAIAIAPGASGRISLNPVSGNALTFNLSDPMGIQGHDQISSLAADQLQEADSQPFPGQAVALWGSAQPLGIFSQQAVAYVSEGAVAGATGIATNITIPTTSGVTLVAQQGELIGVQIPVNYTDEVGVGVYLFLEAGTLTAAPYYFVRSVSGESMYVSSSLRAAPGSSVTLSAKSSTAGVWTFDMGSSLIQNVSSGPGNGTAALGVAQALAFTGNANASSTVFGISSLPLLGIYGNGTVQSVVVPSAIEFTVGGHSWGVPDFTGAWSWSAVGVAGFLTNSALPRGEVEFGAVSPNGQVNGGLLWNSTFQVRVAATPSKVNPGENATITANVTGDFAVPQPASGIQVSALAGPAPGTTLTFTLSKSDAFYANFSAIYAGPSLPSTAWENLTINVTVGQYPTSATIPQWGHGRGNTTVTVFPTQLEVAAHASASSVAAGTNVTVFTWVNDSSGPITGASLSALVTPAVAGYTPSFKSLGKGEYTFAFPSSAALAVTTTYNFEIFANKTGSVGASTSVSVTVTPLPVLSVSISLKDSSGNAISASGITAGSTFTMVVTVTGNGSAVSGVTVTLGSSPLWPGGLATGVTDSSGQYGQTLIAPKVNATTTFTISASASLANYRPGSSNATLQVSQPAAPAASGLPTTDIILIVVVVAVVAVAAGVMMMMRKKKSSGASNASPPEYAGSEAPPAPEYLEEPPAQG